MYAYILPHADSWHSIPLQLGLASPPQDLSRPKREVFEKGECERKKQNPAEVDDVNENLSLKNSDDNAANHTGGNLETLFNLKDTELSKTLTPAEVLETGHAE